MTPYRDTTTTLCLSGSLAPIAALVSALRCPERLLDCQPEVARRFEDYFLMRSGADAQAPLVWCLTNTLMKMRGHFGPRQGAMTRRGDLRSPQGGYHARKSNAADGQKDPQIHKRICETPH